MASRSFAVYSAIFGDRDDYFAPPCGEYDHFLFTDRMIESERTQVIHVERPLPDPKRSSLYYKTNLPQELESYPLVLWADASLALKTIDGLESFVAQHDLAVFRHPHRECIYLEAESCLKDERDHPKTITDHMDRYRKEGYPQNNGLAATGGLLRRRTPATMRFNELWWSEISTGSRRDQLSFNYVSWKLDIPYAEIFPGSVRNNHWWFFRGHRRQDRRLS